MDVSAELQNFLLLHQSSDGLLKRVCPSCLQNFEESVRDISLIQNRMSPAELTKLQLWNHRIELIKGALLDMKTGSLDEAKTKYLEYLKVIEQVLGVASEALTAQVFSVNGRAEELPIYCLVLWDLIVCNDGKDESAQMTAATKMIELAKGTGLRKTLVDRSRRYAKKAKNKKFFKRLQKDFRQQRACYIATYAYGSIDHPQVESLRQYRDQVLRRHLGGRILISVYYFISPTLVICFGNRPIVRRSLRKILNFLIRVLSL